MGMKDMSYDQAGQVDGREYKDGFLLCTTTIGYILDAVGVDNSAAKRCFMDAALGHELRCRNNQQREPSDTASVLEEIRQVANAAEHKKIKMLARVPVASVNNLN